MDGCTVAAELSLEEAPMKFVRCCSGRPRRHCIVAGGCVRRLAGHCYHCRQIFIRSLTLTFLSSRSLFSSPLVFLVLVVIVVGSLRALTNIIAYAFA